MNERKRFPVESNEEEVTFSISKSTSLCKL